MCKTAAVTLRELSFWRQGTLDRRFLEHDTHTYRTEQYDGGLKCSSSGGGQLWTCSSSHPVASADSGRGYTPLGPAHKHTELSHFCQPWRQNAAAWMVYALLAMKLYVLKSNSGCAALETIVQTVHCHCFTWNDFCQPYRRNAAAWMVYTLLVTKL